MLTETQKELIRKKLPKPVPQVSKPIDPDDLYEELYGDQIKYHEFQQLFQRRHMTDVVDLMKKIVASKKKNAAESFAEIYPEHVSRHEFREIWAENTDEKKTKKTNPKENPPDEGKQKNK